jgi:hypothetical protein
MFRIYPNPTGENFILEQEGSEALENVIVGIFNINGTKVITEQLVGDRKHEFKTSLLPAGLYFIKIIADRKMETLKLIKL